MADHTSFYDIPEEDPRSSTGTVYYALGPEVEDTPTAIAADGDPTPDAFELGQNFPNPFNAHTVIPYNLTAGCPGGNRRV